jgi:PhnB protein
VIHSGVPPGWHTLTPRIVVEDPAGLVAFLKQAFDAQGDFQTEAPSQIRIGDSMLMVSRAGARDVFPAFLYVYLPDAEATCRRALEAGAVLLEDVWDTP